MYYYLPPSIKIVWKINKYINTSIQLCFKYVFIKKLNNRLNFSGC